MSSIERRSSIKVVFRFEAPLGESPIEPVEVEAYSQLNLLAHAQLAERSLQSRCGGQCECSTCRVILVSGQLSPMRDPERELLTRVGALARDPRTRLACQVFPEGKDPVVVDVPDRKFQDART